MTGFIRKLAVLGWLGTVVSIPQAFADALPCPFTAADSLPQNLPATNDGLCTVQGTAFLNGLAVDIDNSGTIIWEQGSRLSGAGVYRNNPGAITLNAGNWDPHSISIDNQGTFVNSGEFFFGERSSIFNEGSFTNSGSIFISNGVVVNEAGGLLVNLGGIGVLGGDFINDGLVLNSGGIAAGISPSFGLTNTGTWINTGGTASYFATAQFRNTGTFIVDANSEVFGNDQALSSGRYDGGGENIINGRFSGTNMLIHGRLSGNGVLDVISSGDDPYALKITGTLAPGDGLGELTVRGDLDCESCKFEYQIGDPLSSASDHLKVGRMNIETGLFDFDFLDGYIGRTGDLIELAYSEGGFNFSGVTTSCDGGPLACRLLQTDNTLSLRVPEPGALALLGLGILGMFGLRLRKRRS